VDTEVAMVGRAIKTQVDAQGHRSPCGILSTAVEADLVGLLLLQFLEQLLRLLLGCQRTHRGSWYLSGNG